MLADLDTLLVEITGFCELMVQYQSDEFIFRQLLGVSKFLDFQDEAGKVNIMKLYRECPALDPSSLPAVPAERVFFIFFHFFFFLPRRR